MYTILRKKRYRILIAIEVVLFVLAEVLDSIWHLSQNQKSNDIILLILVIPMWLFLFFLRQEELKPVSKAIVYFIFILLTVAVPLTFAVSWLA